MTRITKKRLGFSIPEMLAVIAIVVIVMAMLLPALNSARDTATVVTCSGNHRNMMQAFRVYSIENRSHMPFNNWLSQDASWRNQGGAGWLYKYPASYPSPFFTEADREGGVIWPLLNGDADIYRCPLEKAPFNTGPTNAITSYLVSGAVTGFGRKLPAYKTYQFRSDAMLMWEVDDFAPPNYYNDGSSYPSEKITRRHGDGLTISFVDGHSEWIKYDDYQIELLESPGRLWCNPGSTNGH
jgi:prepilin-type N-terminal cleavage/methylation domain-containing protein/prepilin-type processing-associated H-X9-DG protein